MTAGLAMGIDIAFGIPIGAVAGPRISGPASAADMVTPKVPATMAALNRLFRILVSRPPFFRTSKGLAPWPAKLYRIHYLPTEYLTNIITRRIVIKSV